MVGTKMPWANLGASSTNHNFWGKIGKTQSTSIHQFGQMEYDWLVVEPTQLKNIRQIGSSATI